MFSPRRGGNKHEVLMHHADAEGDGVARTRDLRGVAIDDNLAGIGLQQAVEDVHQGGFARAVLADKGVDFAAPHLEADVVVGQHARPALGDVAHLDGVGGAAGRSCHCLINRCAHIMSGQDIPAFRQGEEWPSPFVLLDFHLCTPVREYAPITRSNRERRTSRWQQRETEAARPGRPWGSLVRRRAGPPHAGGQPASRCEPGRGCGGTWDDRQRQRSPKATG